MKGQTMKLAVVGSVSKANCFWLCFAYHIMEISSRFLPLALTALAMKTWTFFLLVVMLAVRFFIIRWVCKHNVSSPGAQRSDGSQGDIITHGSATCAQRERLTLYGAWISLFLMSLRWKMRLVAISFLDSIFERKLAYTFALVITLVEFVACLTASARRSGDSDALPSTAGKCLHTLPLAFCWERWPWLGW